MLCCAGACPTDAEVVAVLWLACHDPFPDNAEAASDLWEYSGATLEADFAPPLVRYLGHRNADVRQAAADALAAGLEVSVMSMLISLTHNLAAISPLCQHLHLRWTAFLRS